MNHTPMNQACFTKILAHADWSFKSRGILPSSSKDTSVAHLADCFITLSSSDQLWAKKLLERSFPPGWKGWPIVVKAALHRRKAFARAVSMGIFSDSKYAPHYYGHFVYSHNERGWDVFKHGQTFVSVMSPVTKAAIEEYASRNIFKSRDRETSHPPLYLSTYLKVSQQGGLYEE